MAITSMSGVRTTVSATGAFFRAITGVPDPVDGALSLSRSTTYTYGTSGADTINQAVTTIFTATANTTTQLDFATAFTNAVADATATVTKIKWLLFELLSVAQDSTNGSACSSVGIKPGGTAKITTSPLGSTANNTYTMESGDKWLIEKHNSGAITVTNSSADNLAVVNNDAAVDGKLRVTFLGNS